MKCVSVREKLQSLFCRLDLIEVELWSIRSWPIYPWTLPSLLSFLLYAFFPTLFSTLLYSSLSPQECYILFSAAFLLAIFSLLPCILYCQCISWEFCCRVCLFLFCSHHFCCFTSVESAADVHIIPYNTLVINHASGPSAEVQTKRIEPNKWPTYDIRLMDTNVLE